jgi:glycosyltransferase involved in cell wall biosynthesis
MRKIIESTLLSLDGVIGDPQLWAMQYFDNEAQKEALEGLLASDAMLVHLRKDPLIEITIPSKTQAYMAMVRPLLLAVAGDAARLGQEAGAGLVVDPEDSQALAAAVETLAAKSREELDRMGAQGRSYYREHLALEIGAEKFGALFRQVAKQ